MNILEDILIATVIVLIPTIYFGIKVNKNEKQKIEKFIALNPQKYDSYVDSTTGSIILFSSSYPNLHSTKWMVTDGSIIITTIRNSIDLTNPGRLKGGEKVISFSSIHSVSLDSVLNRLSFSVLEKHDEFIAEGLFDEKIVHAEQPITFKSSDLHIAQTIRDRIANRT